MNLDVSNPIAVVLAAFFRHQFERFVLAFSPRYILFCTVVFGLLSAASWCAALTMAATYFTEKPLLQGASTVGEILDIDVKASRLGTRKRVEYFTTATYAFTTPDGRRFTNVTRRMLTSSPLLDRGSRVDVLYEASNPAHSTMSAGFAPYLSGLRHIMWGMFFIGLFLALYVYRYVRWRCDQAAQRRQAPRSTRPAQRAQFRLSSSSCQTRSRAV